ncbi:NAD(P)H-dependent oxidoreductase [Flavobacteriaceae bacterium]|nr:NAD(P)H-dependent oxidoreductase [Flavobacteriaceae bacterium]MDB4134244.1 NAD(P)H-dependent oxidoreductase [Flavobacteriaceae bacterium]MDB4179865.1 NAD(P)H-dependent oxidoreductase [Flavobacteriaceae bacterium]
MNIIESLNWRYATKKFDSNRKLSKNQVNTLKNAFNLTASSYGLQPIKLIVISNQEIKNNLLESSLNQQQVIQCSHLLVICVETDIDESYIELYFKRVVDIRKTPPKVLESFKNSIINEFNDMSNTSIINWSINQAYLALGNLMTVCSVEEIDSCPMEGFLPEKYDEILDLKTKNLKSVLVMPVGYRSVDDQFSSFKKVRKDINDNTIELK